MHVTGIYSLTPCMLFKFSSCLLMACKSTIYVGFSQFRIFSQFETVSLLSALTCEVAKAKADQAAEEDTWSSEALDILLDAWNAFLVAPPSKVMPVSLWIGFHFFVWN